MDEEEEWGHDPRGESLRSRGHLISLFLIRSTPCLPDTHVHSSSQTSKNGLPSPVMDPTIPCTAASALATSTIRENSNNLHYCMLELCHGVEDLGTASVFLLLPWALFSIFYIIYLSTLSLIHI